MRKGWVETTVEKLVNQKIIEKPLDGNHGEIHPKKSDFTKSGIPFVMASDLLKGAINQQTCNFISREQANSLRKGFAKNGDVLLSHKGTIGRSAILQTFLDYVVLTPQVTYYRILDNSVLDNRFLYYSFHSPKFQNEIKKIAGAGSTRAYIGITQQLQLHIPIAPITEQKRIVAILDKAFEGIDRAIANTEKNLANSRELFESSLQFIFSNREKYWLRLQLSELLQRKWITSHLDGNHGGDYPKKDEFVDSGVPYISANCLKNERVDMSLAKYLTVERADLLRKGIAQNNDVLFAHNATVGPVTVLRTNEIKIILSTSLTYYRCDPQFIIPEYLALYMRSNEFKSQYEAVMRQSTRNQVPITKQRTFYHIVPPIEEQQKIANHLDDLFVETQRLEIIYRQKIAALKEIKQLILQKAFTGELTADTPKTAKEEIAA